MHHPQPQRFFKAIEVAIPVQQFVSTPQAKSGDQAVDRLVNGVSTLAQRTIVFGGGNRHFTTARIINLESQKFPSHPYENVFVPNSLQYFAED